MYELSKWTKDFDRTQAKLSYVQLMHGGGWPEFWIPYFGADPAKVVRRNDDWKREVVKEPYTLHFICTGYWVTFHHFKTQWMASFDPGTRGVVEVVESADFWTAPTFKTKVDIRTAVQYSEDKHKDDVATPTKKWKYL